MNGAAQYSSYQKLMASTLRLFPAMTPGSPDITAFSCRPSVTKHCCIIALLSRTDANLIVSFNIQLHYNNRLLPANAPSPSKRNLHCDHKSPFAFFLSPIRKQTMWQTPLISWPPLCFCGINVERKRIHHMIKNMFRLF